MLGRQKTIFLCLLKSIWPFGNEDDCKFEMTTVKSDHPQEELEEEGEEDEDESLEADAMIKVSTFLYI